MPMKVAVLVGSLREKSINRALARAIEKQMPDGVEFDYLPIGELPLYNQDMDADYPAAAVAFKKRIEAADAVLVVTPEYLRSIPGVLKNALDVASRPWGTNVLAGKPAAVAGASVGAVGTAAAQQHLRAILAHMDAPTLGQPEVFVQYRDGMFDDDGAATGDTADFLQGFADRFVAWVTTITGAR